MVEFTGASRGERGAGVSRRPGWSERSGFGRKWRTALAIVRLREFGDECWRSLQLVIVFMTAAFLFGAPAIRMESNFTSQDRGASDVRPIATTDTSVIADPMRPVSSSVKASPDPRSAP